MTAFGFQPALIAIVIAAIVFALRFEMLCLKDIAQAEEWELRYLSKPAWAVLCVLCIPFGGILYLIYGRAR